MSRQTSNNVLLHDTHSAVNSAAPACLHALLHTRAKPLACMPAVGFSAGTDYNSNSEGSPASSGSSHRFRQPSQELHTPALSVQGVKQSRPSNLQGPMSNGSLSLEQLRARSGPLQEV